MSVSHIKDRPLFVILRFITMEREQLIHYAENCFSFNRQQFIRERRQLLHLIDGELFYSLHLWPQSYKIMFWQKPLSDNNAFRIFLFLIGNGCLPEIALKWILSSAYFSDRIVKMKRLNQIHYLYTNFKEETKHSTWFYYDMQRCLNVYLNGSIKT